jgi:hypothetical protein
MDQEQRIRERAHCLWEEEGRPEGRHAEHWQRACREIDAESCRSGDRSKTAASGANAGTQSDQVGSSGLVGADDVGVGTPDAMGVDDLNVTGRLNDPKADRPSTGRSKLVGT